MYVPDTFHVDLRQQPKWFLFLWLLHVYLPPLVLGTRNDREELSPLQVEKTDVQRRYVTGSGSRSQQAGDSADQGLSRPGTLVGFPMSHLQRADSASRGRRSPCPPPTTCHRELPAAISLPGCPWTMLVRGPPPEDLAVPAAPPLGHISGLPMALCSVPRPLHTHWCCQALPSPRQERHRCWHPQVGAADVEPCGNNSCLLPAVMQTRGPSGAFVSVAKAHGGKGPWRQRPTERCFFPAGPLRCQLSPVGLGSMFSSATFQLSHLPRFPLPQGEAL